MIAFVLLRVFLILLLVAANAFFAAAEFALVSVRDTRIQQLIEARRIGARIVQKLHRNLDEVVNGVLLGITIVSLTLTRRLRFLMSRAAGSVLRSVGSRKLRQAPIHSPDELKLIVTASRQFGQIPPFQEEMIHNALELENITVREVMVPRPDIFSLPGDLTLDEALGRVVEEQHSRIPVYDPKSGPEHIIGVLYAKDLMRWTRLRLTASPLQPMAARIPMMRISQIMHDVLVVPETKP